MAENPLGIDGFAFGACVAGPCLGAGLQPWPLEIRDA